MSSEPLKAIHGLLARQLRRAQVRPGELDEALRRLLEAVNVAYQDFDRSRDVLERSLDLGSQELMQKNAELNALLAERRVAEKEMEALHAQRLEATALLAGGVAHDFNNLLMVIAGSNDMLTNLTDPHDPRAALLRQIGSAVGRAAALTRQLLAFSRSQVLEPRELDLNQILTGLEPIYRPLLGERIALRWALDPELPAISADPAQIEQVVLNLVVNARDAMPEGGTLEVQTARASDVELQARPSGATALVRLSVKDTGVGIPPAVRAHMFEPFFTTKPAGKGTGLGLSTVYGIVRQSGGFIVVDSEVARGTAFHIFLPERSQTAPG